MQISEQKLSRVDLNLLVSLSVLLKEKSVSRAAERLYLSQSAMSRTLQRLRDLFDDPLFHRTATGIIPTVKAQNIEALLPDLIQKLESVFQDDEFDPASCQQHFNLSVPALMSHAFLLPLLQQLENEAPKVKLTEHPAKINPYSYLESGSLDFAIHVEASSDNSFNSIHLGVVTPVIYARKGHPLSNSKKVELQDCFNYSYLDLHIENDTNILFTNPIDILLSKQGFKRDIHLKSSQLSILTQVLKSTDHLLIAPHFFLNTKEYQDNFDVIYSFEQSEINNINLYLLEHQRVENSKVHQWLKGQSNQAKLLVCAI